MTDERIAELRKLAEAATPGPWEVRVYDDSGAWVNQKARGEICFGVTPEGEPDTDDAAFVAACRTAVPELLDALEAGRGCLRHQRDKIVERQARLEEAEGLLREAVRVVEEQVEDEGLWFIAHTAPEGYLQQELRRLHAAIEGERIRAFLEGSDDRT